MPRRNKSFYELEFSVDPGGAHKDDHYIRGTLEEIKVDLARELSEQVNLYLLCWYGACLELRVFERGDRERNVDLHPAITIESAGYPTITFVSSKNPIGHTFKGEENDESSLTYRMSSGSLEGLKVTVDWSKVDVPAKLKGKVVREGDLVNVDGDWQDDDDDMEEDDLLDNGYLPYGHSDFEQ